MTMDPPNKRRRLAPKLPDPPLSAAALPQSHPPQPPPEQAHPPPAPNPTVPDALPPSPPERQDFEAFAKHLQDAAMHIYRQGQKQPYACVSALLLKWDDDMTSSADVSSLERVLRDRYNFHTERWGIPAVPNPSAKLSARIADFLNQADADHLLIIYYVGHSYNSPDSQLYWACNARDDSPKAKWDGVRYLFEDAQSDILVLLDSCAPKDTPIAGSHGAKQVIAACTPEGNSREAGGRTFTSYLVDALHKLGNGRPFKTQRLYDEILMSQQQYEHQFHPGLTNGSTSKLVRPQIPIFLTLTPGRGQTLDLVPMPRNNGPNSSPRPAERDAPVISPAAVADMVFDEARVLVCTTFVGDASPDMACFNQWIANTPPLASRVAVEGMFLGPPTVLLISIPQSLWNIIQHDKICFSLGYINSRNLIHLYDGLVKNATSTPTPSEQGSVYASAKDVEDGRTLLEAREAAVNNGAANHRNEYHSPPYHHHQQLQQQQQQPPPPPQQQQSLPSLQSTLPLPAPQAQNTHLPPISFTDTNPPNRYHQGFQRRGSLPHQQHHHQQITPPPPSLPPIVSRPGSPILPKEESADSAEMKEAAEGLKALSHIRPTNGEVSPPLSMTSSHLSKIAQDVIKCRGDATIKEDASNAATGGVDENAPPAKKSRARKEYRFKSSRTQDGQLKARPLAQADLASSLPTLLPNGGKQDVQCAWCSHEPFKDSSSLRKHIAAAHTRPFPCAFAFAGCTSTFGSKNEWKRHIASQHLCLQYYRCSSCTQSTIDGKGNEFNRKDLFTQHLRRMHAPFYIRKAIQKRDSKVETEWEDYVKEMQKSCCIVRRLPPQRSACPKPGCNRPFEGRSAWDEWTEHVGRHMENGEGESLGVDELLISWALDEGIIMRTDGGGYRLCNPMGSGSSNGNHSTGLIGNTRVAQIIPNEERNKAASVPSISTASMTPAPDTVSEHQNEKVVMPPTPPPTTTRVEEIQDKQQDNGTEMAVDTGLEEANAQSVTAHTLENKVVVGQAAGEPQVEVPVEKSKEKKDDSRVEETEITPEVPSKASIEPVKPKEVDHDVMKVDEKKEDADKNEEAKQESKMESTTDSKAESKAEAPADIQVQPPAEPRPRSQPEARTEPHTESRPEPGVGTRAEPKAEKKADLPSITVAATNLAAATVVLEQSSKPETAMEVDH